MADNGIKVSDERSFDGPYFPDTDVSHSPFVKIVGETYQKTRGEDDNLLD